MFTKELIKYENISNTCSSFNSHHPTQHYLTQKILIDFVLDLVFNLLKIEFNICIKI